MADTKEVDYIIVGQGLAGSTVALHLMQRKKKILLIDQPQNNTSSKIAAGLFNPVTGRKMTKTWMADVIFPYLHTFYRQAQQQSKNPFFYQMPLYRPFLSVEEQNEWMSKSADPAFENYIEKIFTSKTVAHVCDQHGGLLLKQSGYLHTVDFMQFTRAQVSQDNLVLDENFENSGLEIAEHYVVYKGYKAPKIIFCQGENILGNKWFNWVPINPLKGETLTVQTAELPQQIINRGVYIVPVAQNELKIGSTYNFQDSEPIITLRARQELEEKLGQLVDFPYTVVGQAWGKRPTSPDRRPMLGSHPAHAPLIIFNGLGTKGVGLAPYFSGVLVRWLEGEISLNKEVDVNRYKSLYSKSTK